MDDPLLNSNAAIPLLEQTPLLVFIHLTAAILAFVFGLIMLIRKKGTPVHKRLGRVWVALMAFTALSSFFIQTQGHFSVIHVLSVLTLIALFRGVYAIRHGDQRTHRRNMLLAYGGLVIAGLFTLDPHRLLGHLLLG